MKVPAVSRSPRHSPWISGFQTQTPVFTEFLRGCLELGGGEGGEILREGMEVLWEGLCPLQTQPDSIRFNCFVYWSSMRDFHSMKIFCLKEKFENIFQSAYFHQEQSYASLICILCHLEISSASLPMIASQNSYINAIKWFFFLFCVSLLHVHIICMSVPFRIALFLPCFQFSTQKAIGWIENIFFFFSYLTQILWEHQQFLGTAGTHPLAGI